MVSDIDAHFTDILVLPSEDRKRRSWSSGCVSYCLWSSLNEAKVRPRFDFYWRSLENTFILVFIFSWMHFENLNRMKSHSNKVVYHSPIIYWDAMLSICTHLDSHRCYSVKISCVLWVNSSLRKADHFYPLFSYFRAFFWTIRENDTSLIH